MNSYNPQSATHPLFLLLLLLSTHTQLTSFSKLLTTIHIKVVCFSSMYFFAVCCCSYFYFVYFFTQELLNLCFWFILHSLYPTHMFSHHHFICAFCCCFLLFVVVFYFYFTLSSNLYSRSILTFVNNNVERKAEKLASHFLKQLN